MRMPTKRSRMATGWNPIKDPEGHFSTGIADLDRLLGGGLKRGSFALLSLDDTVQTEDLDLVLFPTVLNMLYHSRGVVAVLPSRDSPRGFRERITRYVTRRRFDARVRIIDYAGEADSAPYVVHLYDQDWSTGSSGRSAAAKREMAKMVAAERAVQGGRKKPYLELMAFEIPNIKFGSEVATRMAFAGVKRAREVGNLVVGIVGPGVGSGDAIRQMADTEFRLHRDEVGLSVRGLHPSFQTHLATVSEHGGAPYVAFVPHPP